MLAYVCVYVWVCVYTCVHVCACVFKGVKSRGQPGCHSSASVHLRLDGAQQVSTAAGQQAAGILHLCLPGTELQMHKALSSFHQLVRVSIHQRSCLFSPMILLKALASTTHTSQSLGTISKEGEERL